MEKNKIIYFRISLALFIALIFLLNFNHLNQQGTYSDIFKPIAENVLNGKGYTCDRLGGGDLFYPIWGYTLLIMADSALGANDFLLLFIQAILCLYSIEFFYRIFNLKYKYWHLPLFIPFIALCSVKWPDAIAACMLIFFIHYTLEFLKTSRAKYLILSGIVLGIAVNMRSEYLYLPVMFIIFSIIPKLKSVQKKLIFSAFTTFLIAILMLSPWAIRSYILSGEPRFSASNGGAVLYICLGQLPNNPWKIQPIDSTAYSFALKKGSKNPYSPKMDKALSREFRKEIAKQPGFFALKCAYNAGSSLIRGVYTGEYANALISKSNRLKTDELVTNQKGQIAKFKFLSKLESYKAYPLIIEKIIQALFIPVLLILIISFFYLYFTKSISHEFNIVLGLLLALVIYKFLTISIIQYEYRHMNSIYLLILGASLYFLQNKKEPKSSKP